MATHRGSTSMAWNNGNMYADKNGNIYNYNRTTGVQKYNSNNGSWQSAGKPASSSYSSGGGGWGSSSSWADRAGSAQSSGSDRFDSWRDSGGGGWGGFRGGGGFGGGFRR
ncbi:MAG: hypothetical protein WBN75_09365 [Verrucomicrobiia bacterium]